MAASFAFRAQVRAPVRVAPVRVAVRPVAFLTRVPSVNVAPKSAFPMSFGLVSSTSSAFLGGSLVQRTAQPKPSGRGMLVVVAGKVGGGMACTKRGTKRKRRRVSGFRTRLQTTSGRNVLRRRRQKGRKELCPASVGGRK